MNQKGLSVHIATVVCACLLCSEGVSQKMLYDTLAMFQITEHIPKNHIADTIEIDEPTGHLGDFLKNNHHLQIKDYGPGSSSSASVRGGVAAHTQLLWNGMSMNSPSLGSSDLSLFPLFFIQEVTMLNGAGTLIESSDALTGTISLTNKINESGITVHKKMVPLLDLSDTGLRYTSSADKYSQSTAIWRHQAENAYPYQYRNSKGWVTDTRTNAAESMSAISHQSRLSHSSTSVSSVSLELVDSERQIPKSLYVSETNQSQDDLAFRSVYKYLRESWFLRLGHVHDEQTFRSDQLTMPSRIETNRTRLELGAKLLRKKNVTLHGRAHWTTSTANVSGQLSSRDRLSLSVQGHQEIATRTELGVLLKQEVVNGKKQPLTGVLSLKHKTDVVQIKEVQLTLSKLYRLPSLNDLYWPILGNPDLLAENGMSIEMGFLLGEQNPMNLKFFAGEMSQLIRWAPAQDGHWRPQNVDRMINSGVEVSKKHRLSNRTTLLFSYQYLMSKETDDSEEGQQWQTGLYTPNNSLNVKAERSLGGDFYCTVSYNFSSGMAINRSGDYLDFYSDLSGSAQYNLNDYTIRLGLNNALNRQNELAQGRPLVGRHVSLHINYSFKL